MHRIKIRRRDWISIEQNRRMQ